MTDEMVLVVPAKGLRQAKSRIRTSTDHREAIAIALLRHTLATAALSGSFAAHVVVTADPQLTLVAHHHGAVTVRESGPRGLNTAVQLGRSWVGRHFSGAAVCVMMADLGYAVPEDIRDLVAEFRTWPQPRYVADMLGTGTTTVLLPEGTSRTHFGPDSARQHRRSGFYPTDLAVLSLRHDVDTLEDLPSALLGRQALKPTDASR